MTARTAGYTSEAASRGGKQKQPTPKNRTFHRTKTWGVATVAASSGGAPEPQRRGRVQGAESPAYFPRSDHPHRPGFQSLREKLNHRGKIGRGRPSTASVRPLHPQSLGGETLTAQHTTHSSVPSRNRRGTGLERVWNTLRRGASDRKSPCIQKASRWDSMTARSRLGKAVRHRRKGFR